MTSVLLPHPLNGTQPLGCTLFDDRARRSQATAFVLQVVFGPAGGGMWYLNHFELAIGQAVLCGVFMGMMWCYMKYLSPTDPADASMTIKSIRCCVLSVFGGVLAAVVYICIEIANLNLVAEPQSDYCMVTWR